MSLLDKRPILAAFFACLTLAAWTNTAQAQDLRLSVNPYSGVVTVQNTSTTAAAALDGYQITSAAGRLLPDPTNTTGVGWDSLTDAGLAGWAEYAPTVNALSELNLSSSTSIAAGGSLGLGRAFNPLGARDLAWGYSVHEAGGAQVVTLPGAIQYAGGLQVLVVDLLGAGSVIEATRTVLYNPETVSLNVDAYTISSPGGSLNPAGFNGFTGQGVAGWISVGPSANALSELNLTGSKTFAPGRIQALSTPFPTGATPDLTIEFHLVGEGGAVETGTVAYVQRLSGDANFDGVVDIFDVNVVSANWATSALAGDTNLDGVVDIFDVNIISGHWGNTLGGGGGATVVPEPGAVVLAVIGTIVGCAGARRRRLDAKITRKQPTR